MMARSSTIRIDFKRGKHVEVNGFEVLDDRGLTCEEIRSISKHLSIFADAVESNKAALKSRARRKKREGID